MTRQPVFAEAAAKLGLAILLALFAGSLPTAAATLWWDGGAALDAGGQYWTSLANWSTSSSAATPNPAALPTITDTAVFNTSINNYAAVIYFNGTGPAAYALVISNTSTTSFDGGRSGSSATGSINLGAGGIMVAPDAGQVSLAYRNTRGTPTWIVSANQTWANNSTNDLTSGTAGANGIITLNGDLTLVANAAGDINLGAMAIGGAGGLIINSPGSGQVILTNGNTYTGNTVIRAGTLALSGGRALAKSPNITIAGGATLDVSGLTTPFALVGSQTLSNSSAGAVINGTNDCSAGTLSLTYDGVHPSLIITNGTLLLSGSTGFKVNNIGGIIGLGNHPIITNAPAGNAGMVAGRLPAVVTVNGSGTVGTAALQFNGSGGLDLVVSPFVATIRVETAADGSGTVVPAQSLAAAQTLTGYAIARDVNGGFLANVPTSWGLTNVTGFVLPGDLTPAADGKSAVFTANSYGTAQMVASGNAPVAVPSGVITANVAPIFSATRPFIWATAAERQGILDKIATQPWAAAQASQLVAGVQNDLTNYEANPDAYLRQNLPVLWTNSPPIFSVADVLHNSLINTLNTAQDCSVIYYLTGNPRYARLAADVLQNTINTLCNTTNIASSSVGFAYASNSKDLFDEARTITQIPIIYDFLQGYLATNQVWNVVSTNRVAFSFSSGQGVFNTYCAILKTFNGGVENWSTLVRDCYLHNALGLDDSLARSNVLNYVVDITTYSGNNVLEASISNNVAHFDQAAPYAMDPESFEYATAVVDVDSYEMSVIEHFVNYAANPNPTNWSVYARFALIPESLERPSQISYPGGNEVIGYGDGSHNLNSSYGINFKVEEYVYHTAKQLGRTDLMTTRGGILAYGLASGDYNRSNLTSLPALLWSEPVITNAPANYAPVFRTDTLPFAGIVLQRNLGTSGDPAYGLMSYVGGSEYVHNHASGMAMELYGLGWALGKQPFGRDNYSADFAAHNGVVVNGYSQGSGGWAGWGINPVQVVAMEPAARQSAVSSNISFTCTSFLDNNGIGAEANEQRTMAIIRTSPTNGYYVDIFRSISTVTNTVVATAMNGNVTNQFHDYIYHNIGSSLTLMDNNGNPLSLISQTNRFTDYTYTDGVYGSRLAPGWGAWTNTQTSGFATNNYVRAQFYTKPTGGVPIYMDVHIPGDTNREYATAQSPAISDSPAPYNYALCPTLVVRKYGSAWNNPFVAVFEPHGGTAASGSVTNVTTLVQSNVVVGVKVQSQIGGRSVVQYVIAHTNSTSTYSNAALGLSFKGLFGVATDNGDGTTTLYLGSGSYLSYRGNTVTVAGGTNGAAEVRFVPGQPAVISASAPLTTTVAAVPAFTQISRLANGHNTFTIAAAPGTDYTLWSRTNLMSGSWQMVTNGTVTNNPLSIQATGAATNASCFYRLSTP